jgi:hypothetical protein
MNPIKDGKPIRRATDLQARAKLVAWAMLDVGQGKGNMVTISIYQLQRETGLGRNTVRRAVAELILAGWFRLVSEGRRDHQAAVYEWQGGPLGLFANRVQSGPSNRGQSGTSQSGLSPTLDSAQKCAQLGDTGGRNSKNKLRTRTKKGAARPDASSKKQKTNPNYKPLTDYFCKAWKTKHDDQGYPHEGGKDARAVQAVLRAAGDDLITAKGFVDAYLELEGWAAKQGHKLSVMPGCLAELIARGGHDQNQRGSWDGSKAKRGRLR